MDKRADALAKTDYVSQRAELDTAERKYKLSAAEKKLDKLGPLSSFMYNAH